MEPAHILAIQKNIQSLLAQTDLHVMVTALYEKGVFTEQMIEPYRNPNVDDRTHKRNFYLHLIRRGPRAFKNLIDTLWENGYWNLARDLDPEGEFHEHPRSSANKKSNEESSFISIRTEKKKAESEAETKKHLQPPAPPAQLPVSEPSSSSHLPALPTENIPIPTASFEVKKSTGVIEDDYIEVYPVRGRRRERVMLLYTYMNFKNDIEEQRRGAEIDSANLKHLFHELGFQVISYFDCGKEETEAGLKNLPLTLAGAKCVFVVVSSHGHARRNAHDFDFRCSDGLLFSVLDFIDYFNNRSLPALHGVPKVFIFQACRGSKGRFGSLDVYDGAAGVMPGLAVPPEPRDHDHVSRIYSDILIAHSTVPGYVSRRTPEKGSWYIQTLCRVFAEHAHHKDVETLLTLVDQKMAEEHHTQTSSIDKWGFNSRLYLYPGLDQ